MNKKDTTKLVNSSLYQDMCGILKFYLVVKICPLFSSDIKYDIKYEYIAYTDLKNLANVLTLLLILLLLRL